MRSERSHDGTPPIRVAVWGVGAHAERRLLPALARCAATEIAGIVTRDRERGARVATEHGCPYFADPERMLAHESVDTVLVATPIGCHVTQGLAVLAAGKHLWCEKSLAASQAEADALLAEARRRDLMLAECMMFLHHPQFQAIRAAAAGLGGLVSMTSRFFMPHLDKPGFRLARELGGGGLLDVGCYPLQAASALLGTDLSVREARLVQPEGYDVDTMGFALLESPAGAHAFVEWGFGAAYRNELTLCGVSGSVDADRAFSKLAGYASTLVLRDARGTATTESIKASDAFVDMFATFATAQHDDAMRERLREDAARQAELIDRVMTAAGRA